MGWIENIECDHEGPVKYLRLENSQELEAFLYLYVGCNTLLVISFNDW